MAISVAKAHEDAFEDNPPEPTATIESLRALGYSPASAIADLVDNAIAARARKVAERKDQSVRTGFVVSTRGSPSALAEADGPRPSYKP